MGNKSLILFAIIAISSSALANLGQFEFWYKEYRQIFNKTIEEDCKEEYEYYSQGQPNQTRFEQDKWSGAKKSNQLVFPVANCILDHSSEWMKANMAGATVLLGLTPTMLTALGPSVEEVGMLSIVGHRPLLVALLAAGAPALYPFRGIDYHPTITSLNNYDTDHLRLRPYRFSKPYRYLVLVFEFLIIGAAIYNNIINSLELARQTTLSFAPHQTFFPTLWTFMGVSLHLFASWAIWMRIDCDRPYATPLGWFKTQFIPLADQPALKFRLTKETIQSTLVTWGFTVTVSGYIVLGTITFSSLIFITVVDAVAVVIRYLASLLVCRLVLMYELSILRDNYRPEQQEEHTFIPLKEDREPENFIECRQQDSREESQVEPQAIRTITSAESTKTQNS